MIFFPLSSCFLYDCHDFITDGRAIPYFLCIDRIEVLTAFLTFALYGSMQEIHTPESSSAWMLGLHFWQRIKRGMGTVWFRSLI
jgi:hypothetical protein